MLVEEVDKIPSELRHRLVHHAIPRSGPTSALDKVTEQEKLNFSAKDLLQENNHKQASIPLPVIHHDDKERPPARCR